VNSLSQLMHSLLILVVDLKGDTYICYRIGVIGSLLLQLLHVTPALASCSVGFIALCAFGDISLCSSVTALLCCFTIVCAQHMDVDWLGFGSISID
jgi:hypothetical protein